MATDHRCPYCRTPWTATDSGRCPSCGVVSHRDCWEEYGGCSVVGCASAPRDQVQPAAVAYDQAAASQPQASYGQAAYGQAAYGQAAAAQPAAAPSGIPASWYPDPSRPGQLRWWDGQQWTEHVHPG
jgi:hypothetical protein